MILIEPDITIHSDIVWIGLTMLSILWIASMMSLYRHFTRPSVIDLHVNITMVRKEPDSIDGEGEGWKRGNNS